MLFVKLSGPMLVSLPLFAYGQLSEVNRDALSNNLNNGYTLAPPEAAGIQGSAFLLPGWTAGKLQLLGSTSPLALPLKYDNYHQELRAKRPAGDSVVVPLLRVKEFALAGRRFACYPAPTLPADVAGGCGEILYEGPAAQLLKFQRKEIVKRQAENGSYAATTTVSALEEQTRYYLRYAADSRFVALKPKRNSLEQALAGHPAALAALKTYKGSIGSEAELAAALAALPSTL